MSRFEGQVMQPCIKCGSLVEFFSSATTCLYCGKWQQLLDSYKIGTVVALRRGKRK